MSKITFEMKGFDELAKSLEALGGDAEKEQVVALKEARDYVNNKLRSTLKSKGHVRTGNLLESITDFTPVVKDGKAEVDAGFDFDKQGWKSRFFLAELFRGTPNKQKDQDMWNVLYSSTEKEKRENILIEHFKKVVEKFGR